MDMMDVKRDEMIGVGVATLLVVENLTIPRSTFE